MINYFFQISFDTASFLKAFINTQLSAIIRFLAMLVFLIYPNWENQIVDQKKKRGLLNHSLVQLNQNFAFFTYLVY